ncbi:MAG: TonB-dependent receptor [Gemmatimonas sp.]
MRQTLQRLLIAAGLVAALSQTALAQNTITLEGIVKGDDGAPLVNAQVSAVNVGTQETANTVTRANGEFRLLGLFSGQYRVTVRSVGFKPITETVQLGLGQRARLEFTMERGVAELEAVTAVGERVKQVEVQRMSVSAPVMKEEIENLPLNARGVMNLAGIAPGIKTYAPQSGRTLPSGGAAPDLRFFNVYMDGVEMKSLYNGNIVGLGQTGSPLPQEALEQFRVYLNPYDAEYTRAGSYVISAESRRGTNKWQGSAFGFFQNKDLVARNFIQKNAAAKLPDYGRTQAGFNIRGPLVKDKLFLATSYELTSTDFYLDVTPQTAFAGWEQYRGSFKAPNRNHTIYNRLTYVQNPAFTYDLMVSARYLNGEGNFGTRTSQSGGISQDYDIYTGQLRQRYLSKGGNFVNEASLQLVSWSHNEAPLQPGPQRTYPGIITGTSGFPLILKETHARFVDRATLNVDKGPGSHVLKFGVELSSIAASQDFANNFFGSFNFPTDTSTMPNTASIAVGFTDPNGTSDARAKADAYTTGVYINDEWRIADNFTLSLGVRHDAEFNTMNNDYTVPWASDTVLTNIPALRNYLNRGTRKNQLGNFSPRASFSWDPFKQNKTFVRGGFGIIYDRVTSFIGFQERKNSTWRTYNFVNPGTTDPAVLRARVISGASGSPAPILIKDDMKTPHSTQYSIGIGHQITNEWGVNVDYMVQHMDNLYVQRNPNYVDRSVTPNVRKLTPKYGDIILWDDIGQSDFSAVLLQSTWQRGTTRLNLAYTLGWYQGDFDTAALPNFTYNFLFNRQATTGDERHRVVFSNVIAAPLGFTVSSISTLASPRPFLTTVGPDVNLNNIFTDDYPGGSTTSTGIRTTRPVNSIANWYKTIDLRIARPLVTAGSTKISFSAEVFNLFNWKNNQGYNTIQATTAGVPLATFGQPNAAFAGRQAQVGMKLDWQ